MSKASSVEILDLIRPPDGFFLDCLLVCTYTFDLDLGLALLAHVSDNSSDSKNILDNTPGNKEKLRQLLSENLPKTLFVCDGHGILFDENGVSGVKAVCTNQIVKRTRNKMKLGSFHPKLILAIYSDEKKNTIGRLYIGSKNLSKSSMQEFGVVLNLESQGKKTQFNSELLVMLKDIDRYEIDEHCQNKRVVLSKAIALVQKHNLTSQKSEVDLYWQSRWNSTPSLSQKVQTIFKKEWLQIHIHSLWVRKSAIQWIVDSAKEATIKIKCLRERGFDYPALKSNGGYKFEESSSTTSYQKWHQKIILFVGKTKEIALFGSANFTTRAWGFNQLRNSEVMVSFNQQAGDFDYLCIKENLESSMDLSNESQIVDPRDEIRDQLSQIEVKTEYLKGKKIIRYCLNHNWRSKLKLNIYHYLAQAPEDGNNIENNKRPVFSGKRLPDEIELPTKDVGLHLYSSLLRFEAEFKPGEMIYVDSILDLPDVFYNSKSVASNLECFRLDQNQIVAAILDLSGQPLPNESPSTRTGIGGGQTTTEIFARHISLEKLAFSIHRKKESQPKLYLSEKIRLQSIKKDIEGIIDEPSPIDFKLLLNSINAILNVI